MTVEEAFRILEVPTGSSLADVERSYRKLCRVWHPDRFGTDSDLHADAEAKLKQLNVAWDTIRKHYASSPTPEMPGSDSPAGDDRVFRESVSYLGSDPRLRPVGTIERMKGGRPAIVEFTQDAIVLITLDDRNQPNEFAVHQRENVKEIRWTSYETKDLLIRAKDPEGIVPSIETNLRFKNDYAVQVTWKRANELFGFVSGKPKRPPAATPPRRSESTASDEKPSQSKDVSDQAAAFLFYVFVVLVVVVIVFATILEVEKSNRQSRHDRSLPSQQAPNPFAAKPGAVERGNFTVWTEPRDPAPGEDMRVWIAIRVPAGTSTLPVSDVKGRPRARYSTRQVSRQIRNRNLPRRPVVQSLRS